MKTSSFLILSLNLSLVSLASAAVVSAPASASDRIQTSGGSGSADFYASGNDDAFGSYSIGTFNFGAADFGEATVDSIVSVTLELTFNDRGFLRRNFV